MTEDERPLTAEEEAELRRRAGRKTYPRTLWTIRKLLATLDAARADTAGIDAERLGEAIWNAVSTRAWAEHGEDECDVCQTHREIVREDATRIAREYAALRTPKPEGDR